LVNTIITSTLTKAQTETPTATISLTPSETSTPTQTFTPSSTPTDTLTSTPTLPPAPIFANSNFVYDGDGKRVKSVLTTNIGSTTTYFVGNYYEVTNGVTTKYYYAGSQRIAMSENGELNFILFDHLGSSNIITDILGNVITQHYYKAWGETRYSSGNEVTEYQYTSQYSHMSNFGLYFYNARFYDPALGRFISADSIIPEQTQGVQAWDRYAYVNNLPTKYTDPTGHIACYGDRFDDGPQCRQEGSPSWEYYHNWDYIHHSEEYKEAVEELKDYGQLGLSLAFEPADWTMTLNDCANGNCSVLGLAFMAIPGLSGKMGKNAQEFAEYTIKNFRHRPSTVAVLEIPDGRIYYGYSGHGQSPNSILSNTIKPGQHPHNFGCAEVHCINQALQDNPDPTSLQGSVITTLKIRFPENTLALTVHSPCPGGCSVLLETLGIKFVP
jgi:RHS repeat-associated protein